MTQRSSNQSISHGLILVRLRRTRMSRKDMKRPRVARVEILVLGECFQVTWAHLTIGVLAGLQCLAFSQKVQIPAMFVNSNSALVPRQCSLMAQSQLPSALAAPGCIRGMVPVDCRNFCRPDLGGPAWPSMARHGPAWPSMALRWTKEMGLMLNYVMIKPLTVDSFFILFLFLGARRVNSGD